MEDAWQKFAWMEHKLRWHAPLLPSTLTHILSLWFAYAATGPNNTRNNNEQNAKTYTNINKINWTNGTDRTNLEINWEKCNQFYGHKTTVIQTILMQFKLEIVFVIKNIFMWNWVLVGHKNTDGQSNFNAKCITTTAGIGAHPLLHTLSICHRSW